MYTEEICITYTCTHSQIHFVVHKYTCMHARAHTHTHKCTLKKYASHTHTNTHSFLHTNTHMHTHTHITTWYLLVVYHYYYIHFSVSLTIKQVLTWTRFHWQNSLLSEFLCTCTHPAITYREKKNHVKIYLNSQLRQNGCVFIDMLINVSVKQNLLLRWYY